MELVILMIFAIAALGYVVTSIIVPVIVTIAIILIVLAVIDAL